jgi:3',5'-cyclic AMP phosphodiesterase CpdA
MMLPPDLARPYRLVHVSDIHFWRYALNPIKLLSKRLLGMGELMVHRARRFRLERIEDVVERVQSLSPDHILITGDLTTTALAAEFRAARRALEPWLANGDAVSILPGNHDRYTVAAHRDARFEQFFGSFAPTKTFPWVRFLEPGTAILGLDPTRAGLTARGKLPEAQLEQARVLLAEARPRIRRLLVACHYPLDAPPAHRRELARKRLINASKLAQWLSSLGPHLYCCGHVHAAWAFAPEALPHQLCLNPGAPLLRDRVGHRPPGFLEILLEGRGVTVHHHAWKHEAWERTMLHQDPGFFPVP